MQEIKDILEKIERPKENELVPAWWIRKNILSFVDQTLAKLKEVPEPADFTKEMREKYEYAIKNRLCVHISAYVEALSVIDRLTDKYDRLDLYNCDMMQKYQKLQAENKKLVEGQKG